ncbi:hypothetical protein MKW92_047976, partial [Papaver armeniacum]
DPYNSSRNRGFAFVKYHNNTCAEYSREKPSRPKFKLDKNAPIAKWADPKHSDTLSSSQVIIFPFPRTNRGSSTRRV